ncbi:MAG TPA: hypothetical protein VGK17_15005 [Propionicimonas sp.]|jgi:hypothetical protein
MTDSYTAEQIQAKWHEVADILDILATRVGNSADEWPIEPRSSLAGDDLKSSPYRVSHAVISCLTTGVLHLHAIKTLVIDAEKLHTGVPWTLARAAIENLAVGYWMLQPASRAERITRVLQWHRQNFVDLDKATQGIRQIPKTTSLEEKINKLYAVGEPNGIDAKTINKGYQSTPVVKYFDEHLTPGENHVLFLWQAGSGAAHGRPWFSLGINEREIVDAGEEGVVLVKLSETLDRVLLPTLSGVHMVEDLLRLLDQRRRAMI